MHDHICRLLRDTAIAAKAVQITRYIGPDVLEIPTLQPTDSSREGLRWKISAHRGGPAPFILHFAPCIDKRKHPEALQFSMIDTMAHLDDKKVIEDEDAARIEATVGPVSSPASDQIRRDKYGIPLEPQPSDHKDDPLNWPWLWRFYITILMSLLAFIAQLGSSLINPAFVLMSKDLGVTVVQASYATTVFILFGGVLSMFVVPFANVYGRRICYIIFIPIAAAGAFASAGAPTYGGVIAGRVFNGIGASVPLGLGAATICDLFTQGERGLYMGIYTVSVTNGPHIAPIAGGYIAAHLGWRWCFWIPGIIQAALWVILLFTMPETLFSRKDLNRVVDRSYFQKLVYAGRHIERKVKWTDFIESLRMARYIAVLLPTIWYVTHQT